MKVGRKKERNNVKKGEGRMEPLFWQVENTTISYNILLSFQLLPVSKWKQVQLKRVLTVCVCDNAHVRGSRRSRAEERCSGGATAT